MQCSMYKEENIKDSGHKHSVLESRDITLPTKVQLVKAMFFPVVMYGYEGWSINLSAE